MSLDLSDVQLDALLKRLHLANTRRAWRDLVQRAEQEEWGYRDYLTLLVSEEIAHRQQTRVARMVRRARFPFLKTIDDFNFMYQSTVRLSLLGSALAPDFVASGAIAFATAMGAFGTAFTLATNIDVLAMLIYTEFTLSANIAMAAALSVASKTKTL